MNRRLGLMFGLAMAVSGCATDNGQQASEAETTQATKPANSDSKFKVCADPVNPPYSTREQTGYENEIAQLFARQLGKELEYTWLPDRIGFVRNTLKAETPDGKGFKCDVIMGVPAGFDMVATTNPYLRSNYVLLIAKGRGWDDISTPDQLGKLDAKRKKKLKVALFDRGPGTQWLAKKDLIGQGIPYQSMTGDAEHNTAMQVATDLGKGKIDMVILWGPMAAYVQNKAPDKYIALNMTSSKGMRFDFPIAMGVRQADKERKEQLNKLIETNRPQIQAILAKYGIPQMPLEKPKEKAKD